VVLTLFNQYFRLLQHIEDFHVQNLGLKMNVSYRSKDWRERILLNFAATPFIITINGEEFSCASVEGFWQGLKCKGEMRNHVFGLSGLAAKRAGRSKKASSFVIAGIRFRVGSVEHEELIRDAIRQKILQNEKAKRALEESSGQITHHVSSRVKPIFRMERMLMSIRKELFDK